MRRPGARRAISRARSTASDENQPFTAGRDPSDGVARTVDLATAELSASYARDVTAVRTSRGGVDLVEVTVRAPIPVVGLLGPGGTLVVRGHAMVEGP